MLKIPNIEKYILVLISFVLIVEGLSIYGISNQRKDDSLIDAQTDKTEALNEIERAEEYMKTAKQKLDSANKIIESFKGKEGESSNFNSNSLQIVILIVLFIVAIIIAGPFLYRVFYKQKQNTKSPKSLNVGLHRGNLNVQEFCKDQKKNLSYTQRNLPKEFTKKINE